MNCQPGDGVRREIIAEPARLAFTCPVARRTRFVRQTNSNRGRRLVRHGNLDRLIERPVVLQEVSGFRVLFERRSMTAGRQYAITLRDNTFSVREERVTAIQAGRRSCADRVGSEPKTRNQSAPIKPSCSAFFSPQSSGLVRASRTIASP